MKKVLAAGVAVAAVLSLAACSVDDVENAITGATMSAQQLAATLDAGATVVEASMLPLACGVAAATFSYASALESSGLLASNATITGDITAIGDIYQNPACTQALAGGTPPNAVQLIADLGALILKIRADTSGKVTAVGSVNDAKAATPAQMRRAIRRYALQHHMKVKG